VRPRVPETAPLTRQRHVGAGFLEGGEAAGGELGAPANFEALERFHFGPPQEAGVGSAFKHFFATGCLTEPEYCLHQLTFSTDDHGGKRLNHLPLGTSGLVSTHRKNSTN
jgi:hypothetical protein